MNEHQEIELKLKKLMPELIEKFHIEKLGYFGSFADGSYTDNSDVDILVHFRKPIGWEFFDLQDLLETHLKRKIDLVSVKALKMNRNKRN